jgi:hypothetical protein
MLEKLFIEIVIVLCVLSVGLLLSALTARRCPTCNSTKVYFRHARKDGSPDRRFKFNPLICANCAKTPNAAHAYPAAPAAQPNSAPIVVQPEELYKAGDWITYDGAMVARLGTRAKICVQVEVDAQGLMQPFARLHRHPEQYRLAKPDEIQRALEGDNVTYYNQNGTRDTFYEPIKNATA